MAAPLVDEKDEGWRIIGISLAARLWYWKIVAGFMKMSNMVLGW